MDGADDLDNASDLALASTEYFIRVTSSKAAAEQSPVNGVYPHLNCVDCDDPLPDQRLKLGRIRCVQCQSALERKTR